MADENTAVAVAPAEPVDTGVNAVPVVEELSGKGREKWLNEAADFPKPPAPKTSQDANKAESQPAAVEAPKSDEKAESSPATEVAETTPDSATGEPTQETGKKEMSEHEKRIRSLSADVKLLKQKLSQYEQPAASKPATTEQSADPQRPDPAKFETMDQYLEALSDYKVEKALIGERQRVAKQQQDDQQHRQVNQEREQWNSKIGDARKKHTDFDSVALNPNLSVLEGSAVDWWVMNRPNGAEVLYHLGQNPELLESVNQMPAHEAAYELARIEMELSAPPKPAPLPRAPRPPTEATVKGSVDPLAAALQAGDFSTYRRLKDAEERKGRS